MLNSVMNAVNNNDGEDSNSMITDEEMYLEKLDFRYLENCSNSDEIVKCIDILEKGTFGFYPDLLNFAKTRLHKVDPLRALKYSSTLTSKKASYNEIKSMEEDIKSWSKMIKEHESKDPSSTLNSTVNGISGKSIASKNIDITTTETSKRERAEDLKVKGNESLKCGDIDEAILFYSKSLKVLLQSHVLNNRSLAYFKKKLFSEALMDASESIRLDPGVKNVKAYLRRAMAKKSKGMYFEALEDFIMAQKYDPSNLEYENYRKETERKYLEVEGIRSKTLPDGCSKEAIQKQQDLRQENRGFRRLSVIQEETDDNANARIKSSDDSLDVGGEKFSVSTPKIVEIIEESESTPKIMELSPNEIEETQDEQDDFKPMKIIEIDQEEEDDVNEVEVNEVEVNEVEVNEVKVNEVEVNEVKVNEVKVDVKVDVDEKSLPINKIVVIPEILSDLELAVKKQRQNPAFLKEIFSAIPIEKFSKWARQGIFMDSTILSALLQILPPQRSQSQNKDTHISSLIQEMSFNPKFEFIKTFLTRDEKSKLLQVFEVENSSEIKK